MICENKRQTVDAVCVRQDADVAEGTIGQSQHGIEDFASKGANLLLGKEHKGIESKLKQKAIRVDDPRRFASRNRRQRCCRRRLTVR